MHIGLTRLLENSIPNAKFDADKRFCTRFTGFDWDYSTKIEEAIVANKDDKDEKADFQEKNRRLKREKQY